MASLRSDGKLSWPLWRAARARGSVIFLSGFLDFASLSLLGYRYCGSCALREFVGARSSSSKC